MKTEQIFYIVSWKQTCETCKNIYSTQGEVKPILRSDEEKELHVTSSRGSAEVGS